MKRRKTLNKYACPESETTNTNNGKKLSSEDKKLVSQALSLGLFMSAMNGDNYMPNDYSAFPKLLNAEKEDDV